MNLKWAIYDSRLGRGTKRAARNTRCGRRERGDQAFRRVRLRLFALRATTELGEAIASALGPPLSAHEERQFEDGEHKTRPLETVGGMDVYVVQMAVLRKAPTTSSAGSCFSLARSRTPGRRAWCRPGFRPNINRFTSGQSDALAGTRPSCKRSASWFCLAHDAENLLGLFRWRRARPRLGKECPMSNGPAARHARTLRLLYILCQGHRDSE
jgi:hypothetical protein